MRRMLFVTMSSNLMDVLDAIIDDSNEDRGSYHYTDAMACDVMDEVLDARRKQREARRDSPDPRRP